MKPKIDDRYFCSAPFISLNTRGHGNARVCCTIKGLPNGIPKAGLARDDSNLSRPFNLEDFYNLSQDPISDIWNSRFMRDFRMKMMQGDPIPSCSDCYRLEEKGLTSKRLSRNKRFLKELIESNTINETYSNGGHLKEMPSWWEIRYSTKCNLTCYTCSPGLSSKMHNEYKSNFERLEPEKQGEAEHSIKYYESLPYLGQSKFFLSQFFENISNVKYLELRGGEVFADKSAIEFLHQISLSPAAKNIHLDITTNTTIFSEDLVETLNRFKSGSIRFSIDAFGEQNEYMRTPTKWKDVVKTLDIALNLNERWSQIVQSTLTAYQVLDIVDLLKFVDKRVRTMDHDLSFSFTLVRGYPYLVHEIIPYELRELSAESVKKFLNSSYMCQEHKRNSYHHKSISGLISTILSNSPSSQKDLKTFFRITASLDRVRSNNLTKTFPKLKAVLEQLL